MFLSHQNSKGPADGQGLLDGKPIDPDTLGIETVLIPRNSRAQTSKSKIVTTYHWQYQDNQEQVS